MDPLPQIPVDLKIELRDFAEVDIYLNQLLADGVTFLNYQERSCSSDVVLRLVAEIRARLADVNRGAAVLDLGVKLTRDPESLNKPRLLIVLIGNQFGRTVTRNHLGDSPFLPVYHRQEGKGDNYIGNALSNNQPGMHTDGSAWRKARVDLIALLAVSPAFRGGETILANAIGAFGNLPDKVQQLLLTRPFIRQDPFDHQYPQPVRRTVYHAMKTCFYEGLSIKYHRVRIEGGHQFLDEPLSAEDIRALNELEQSLKRTKRQFGLGSGQVLFINNNFICHNRTSFIDSSDQQRYLERYWAGQHYDDGGDGVIS